MKIIKLSQEENKKWIGVDLDGTLAEYDSWIGPENIGKPIGKMVDRVERWIDEGKTVKILTARVAHAFGKEEAKKSRKYIREWLIDVFGEDGEKIEITCVKDQKMEELWDDRAISIKKNTGEIYLPQES